MTRRRRVFILGGGAGLGAHQVGALKFLEEQGVRPDAIVASSIGVLNACLYVSGGITTLEERWQGFRSLLRLRPSLRHNPLSGLSLCSPDAFAEFAERGIDYDYVRRAPIELSFVLMNLSRARGEFLSNRHVRSAEELHTLVRAGYALPGIFPPVEYHGEWYCDGGFAWNVPVEQALELGATEIFVLALISSELPFKARFRGFPDYLLRFIDVVFATVGNAGFSTTQLDDEGRYRGVPVHVIQPSEQHAGLSVARLLWLTPERTRRLVTAGYRDAKRAWMRSQRLGMADSLGRPEPAYRHEVA